MVRSFYIIIKLNFFEVTLYGSGIRYDKSRIHRLGNVLNRLKNIISIIAASVIFLVEEMLNVFIFYKECKKIHQIAKKQNIFKNLSLEDKKRVENFYNVEIEELDKAQKLLCRESSIQVALQFTLILYQEILVKLTL